MIEIRNLMFQPLTFQLAGGIESLHLGPREREIIPDEQVSVEMRRADEGGFVTLSEVTESEDSPDGDQSAGDVIPEAMEPDVEAAGDASTASEVAQTKKRR